MGDAKIGSVMVVGGGVTGMQAALDLADSGYYVYLVEESASIGGIMSQLDKTFPTNDCSMCILSPKLVEVGRHINIELLTLSEVKEISGRKGDFRVHVTRHPRYVDVDKCIACGACAEKCPKKVPNAYDGGLGKRKAIYVKYPQAVPLKYAIDDRFCIKLTKGKCGICEKICPADAINYEDKREELEIHVGAVILAHGVETYDPKTYDTFQYAKSPNVVTSLEFERILSASGPFGGHLVRPSDHKEPEKIAWLQCIGSRDAHLGRGYCSGVCCTYAIKEALLAKEHAAGDLDTAIFYIDVRTYGKDFEQYYNRSKEEYGVRFVKSRITTVTPVGDTGRHMVRYVDAGGNRMEEEFDMVVLSVGLSTTQKGRELARRLGVETDEYGFAGTGSFDPVATSTPGIYVCGAFESPKDIPTSVVDASAVAGEAGALLSEARNTLKKTAEIPRQTDIRGEAPRIGVFVCRCGTNIAGVVDVPTVVDYAKTLPGVVYVGDNMFSCSQDTQDKMAALIKDQGLNRIVVAACTPKTHEPLFQETMTSVGLNKYLFDMCNIRNQCSWVHKDAPEGATQKAKDLVRMSVAKVALLDPLTEPVLDIHQNALVIGGGVAGMEAARNLSAQGYHTYLVEITERLGGQARHLRQTWRGEDVQAYLAELETCVRSDGNIEIFTNTRIDNVTGFVGNFNTTVTSEDGPRDLTHGVTVFALGASEYKPESLYLYGQSDRVLTNQELEKRFMAEDPNVAGVDSAVFIQCVGSRIPERPYCSRVCCTQSIKNALALKERRPNMSIRVLYRDMRPYGLREDLYRRAREAGVMFIRYDFDKSISVTHYNGGVKVAFTDSVLHRPMEIRTRMLVLASAVIPQKENPLAQMFKVTQKEDGFFAEAHVKLRPSDFATDGVFLAGLCHAPKSLDESITQAKAAAARAVTLLSKKSVAVSGIVARVDSACCSACGVCVSICPYSAPRLDETSGKAVVQSTLCKGCGLCVSSCRSGAIHLKGFDISEIMAQIGSL